jgi:hypothetical protein
MTNDHLTRHYFCARCWGAIVEKNINGEWVAVCAADETHAGFVTQNFVNRRRIMNRLEAAEVGSQYAKILRLARPNLKAASQALYGDE